LSWQFDQAASLRKNLTRGLVSPDRRPIVGDNTEVDLAAEARAGRFDLASLHFPVCNFLKSFGFHVSIGITGGPRFALFESEHTLEVGVRTHFILEQREMSADPVRKDAFGNLLTTLMKWGIRDKRVFATLDELERENHITSGGVALLNELLERVIKDRNEQITERLQPSPLLRAIH
jgi:hypothetical protein